MVEDKPNPFAALFRSRKFWIAVMDALAGILALWVGALVPKEMATLILATWGLLQPVLLVVIAAIAYEDKAKLEAKTRVAEALDRYDALDTAAAPHDITTLIGLCFAKRDFRNLSLPAALTYFEDTFGYTDLTDAQETAFCQAFDNPALRAAVGEVWKVYDQERQLGNISVASPWYD